MRVLIITVPALRIKIVTPGRKELLRFCDQSAAGLRGQGGMVGGTNQYFRCITGLVYCKAIPYQIKRSCCTSQYEE